MRPRTARAQGGWLALLVGLALAACSAVAPGAPADAPPDGFGWEELKEIRAWMLRPTGWQFRRTLPACPFFDFSPEPFTGPVGVGKGVGVHVMAQTGKPADDVAAVRVAQWGAQLRVLRGWTRKGVPAGPFTTYGIVYIMLSEDTWGVECTCELVLVANRVTNTVYQCWLVAPTAEWKEVEATGETMLANLQLDPEF